MKFNSEYDCDRRAQRAVGKKICEIVSETSLLKYQHKPTDKGWVGNAVQEDWFGVDKNSDSQADFPNIGVDLKVTPIYKTHNGWSAQQRLTLGMIDYAVEPQKLFENSEIFTKCGKTELVYYQYKKNVAAPEFRIKKATLIDLTKLPEADLEIIKQDWETIVNKIMAGKAQELSDSLTTYLAATTKGGRLKKQPYNPEVDAKSRAFTFKTTYMTALAREIMNGTFNGVSQPKEISEQRANRIVKQAGDLKSKSFEEIVLDRFQQYIGRSKRELAKHFGIEIPLNNDKASNRILARKMLEVEIDVEKSEELAKGGIAVKTLSLDDFQLSKKVDQRKMEESFKLGSYFKFEDIVKEDFEQTEVYQYLQDTRFLLVCFQMPHHGERRDAVFAGAKFWRMPLSDLRGLVSDSYLETSKVLKQGVQLTYVEQENPFNTGKSFTV